MISLLIFGFIASAYAVPHFERQWHSHHHFPLDHGTCPNQSQFDSTVTKFWTDFDVRMKNLENKLTVWTNFDQRMKDLDNRLIVWNDFDKRMKELDNKLTLWTGFDVRMKNLDSKLTLWSDLDRKMKDLDTKLSLWTNLDKKMKDLDTKLTLWTDLDKKMKDLDNKLTLWSDLDKKMKDLDNKLTVCTDFDQSMKVLVNKLTEFPPSYLTIVSQEGIVGNEYVITIPLSGFEKNDIIVKIQAGGYVSIQANHKNIEGNENIYSNSRILPTIVKLDGKWTYENGVLKITFPLKEDFEPQTVESVNVIRTDITTESPTTVRKDVESTTAKNSANVVTEENFDIDERFGDGYEN